ncbi:peptidoglycan recognition protein family protein [Haloferula sargassicola]|uniref:N-acetylmuramoyl-L-alanine amidase n=1 Tax=Haloferula sargassicola TaxID=490096 RepID=A0ABP9UTI9_9BACT
MRWQFFLLPVLALTLSHCSQVGPSSGYSDVSVPVFGSRTSAASVSQVKTNGVAGLRRSINLHVDMVPKGTKGRWKYRPMTPRYITIHSTQNYSADAERHALALKRGALRAPMRRGGNRIGYLIWHFTVDDDSAVQHMPCTEQGEHADFDGPGNNYSIGIEMCEQRGSNIQATIDRTARLTAYLMHQYHIPASRIVPHYHWERKGLSQPHKNCPHFLLENGRPGAKWRRFQQLCQKYYDAAN